MSIHSAPKPMSIEPLNFKVLTGYGVVALVWLHNFNLKLSNLFFFLSLLEWREKIDTNKIHLINTLLKSSCFILRCKMWMILNYI